MVEAKIKNDEFYHHCRMRAMAVVVVSVVNSHLEEAAAKGVD